MEYVKIIAMASNLRAEAMTDEELANRIFAATEYVSVASPKKGVGFEEHGMLHAFGTKDKPASTRLNTLVRKRIRDMDCGEYEQFIGKDKEEITAHVQRKLVAELTGGKVHYVSVYRADVDNFAEFKFWISKIPTELSAKGENVARQCITHFAGPLLAHIDHWAKKLEKKIGWDYLFLDNGKMPENPDEFFPTPREYKQSIVPGVSGGKVRMKHDGGKYIREDLFDILNAYAEDKMGNGSNKDVTRILNVARIYYVARNYARETTDHEVPRMRLATLLENKGYTRLGVTNRKLGKFKRGALDKEANKTPEQREREQRINQLLKKEVAKPANHAPRVVKNANKKLSASKQPRESHGEVVIVKPAKEEGRKKREVTVDRMGPWGSMRRNEDSRTIVTSEPKLKRILGKNYDWALEVCKKWTNFPQASFKQYATDRGISVKQIEEKHGVNLFKSLSAVLEKSEVAGNSAGAGTGL